MKYQKSLALTATSFMSYGFFMKIDKNSFAKSGFTLMEMMIVMGIIAVLTGGMISLLGDFDKGPKIQKTETEMRALSATLLQYKTLGGRYPTQQQGLQALVTKPTTAPIPRRHSPIKGLAKDPWGNDYIYKMPGSKDATTYEIISFGPDGKAGGDDDISSQDE